MVVCGKVVVKRYYGSILMISIDNNYSENWIKGLYMWTVQVMARMKKELSK